VESKRGRGKGGSRVATFQRDDGTVITVGTPKHLDVLNISVDGNFYGITDERQEPFIYPVNEEMAVNFKTAVKTAIGKNDEVKLQLVSSLPYLNGIFRVANSRNDNEMLYDAAVQPPRLPRRMEFERRKPVNPGGADNLISVA
jgi:hypothetical protein